MKRIVIFKAGRHTDMAGRELEFGERQLQDAASSYDPGVHEAPVVVGHPTTNAPAWGWVKKVVHDGGALSADVDQLNPAFVEAVQDGRYKKISASFYLPDSKANPAPGSLYLRHVGFLGGRPPAVKGLPAVDFAEETDGLIECSLDFADVRAIQLESRLESKPPELKAGK